jgi:AIR synthase-related protein
MAGSASETPGALAVLAEGLRNYRGLAHKRDVQAAVAGLATALPAALRHDGQTLAVGDDCAALPDGDGYLLFAIEGFLADFVAAEPWFAGWCGVMVNLADVAAMGGHPLAVVDALWSDGPAAAGAILAGLRAAATAYGVPVVGGHSNTHAATAQLAVAVLGRARRLLTSFDAQAGDTLMMAVDLRGHWHEPYPFFDAATSAPAGRLRDDLALLPALAERGLCRAGKDISMAGIVGTAAMLMECSGLGGTIDLDALPRPAGVEDDLARWLRVFPSFGYLLAVAPESVCDVSDHFTSRQLACRAIGSLDDGGKVRIRSGQDTAEVWDLRREPLTGCALPDSRAA